MINALIGFAMLAVYAAKIQYEWPWNIAGSLLVMLAVSMLLNHLMSKDEINVAIKRVKELNKKSMSENKDWRIRHRCPEYK